MPKEQIEGLISQFADQIGEHNCSIQQKQLLEGVERHVHKLGEPDQNDPEFKEMLELLLIEFKEEHPKAAATLEEIIDVLGKMGL